MPRHGKIDDPDRLEQLAAARKTSLEKQLQIHQQKMKQIMTRM